MWDGQFRVRLCVAALLLAVAVCLVYILRAVSETNAALPSSEIGASSPGGTHVLHTADDFPDAGRGQLTQYGVLRVQVLDEGHVPIEGATVALQESPPQEDAIGDDRASGTATVRTGVDGRCELTVRRNGAPYLLIASAAGFRAETMRVLPRSGSQEVTFVLVAELGPEECRVSGVVVDQHGNGLPNVEVMAFHGFPAGGTAISRRTREDGLFSMAGLKPGECRLAAYLYLRKAEGGERNIPLGWPDTPLVTFDLRGGEHKKGVRIVLPKYSLSGRVTNERGIGVAQARVVPKQKEMPLAEVQSETGGAFSITGIILFEGGPVVDVECAAAGYEPTQLTGIPLDTANLQIVLQPADTESVLPPTVRGSIRGTVYDALTRQPVSGARVAAAGGTSESAERWEELSRKVLAVTNAEGMFTLDDVRAGVVYLLVHAEDYGLREIHVDVAGNRTTEIDIPLSRAGILKVNLTREDTAELPITHFYLRCYPPGQVDNAYGVNIGLQRLLRGQYEPRDSSFNVHDGDELHLAPGEYDVRLKAVSIASLETAGGAITCESDHTWSTRVVIESGETTEVGITVGSPYYVLISAKPRPNTYMMIAHMIPGDNSDLDWSELYRNRRELYYSSVGVGTVDPGSAVWIGILNVKPGSYRVGLYDRQRSRKPELRDTAVVHVSRSRPSIVQFD